MGLGPTYRARNQPFFGGVPHPPDPTDRANHIFFCGWGQLDIFFCGWGQLDGVVFGGVFPMPAWGAALQFFFAAGVSWTFFFAAGVSWWGGIRWGVPDRTNQLDFGGVGLPRPGYPTWYRDPSLVTAEWEPG